MLCALYADYGLWILQFFGSIQPCIPAHIPAHTQCEGWYISKKTGMLWTTWKAVSNSAHKQLQDAVPSRLMMGRVEQDYMKGPNGISRPKCSWVSQDTTSNTGINKQGNVSPGACSLQLDLTEQFGQMRFYSVTPKVDVKSTFTRRKNESGHHTEWWM